jgi:hypothetical protein
MEEGECCWGLEGVSVAWGSTQGALARCAWQGGPRPSVAIAAQNSVMIEPPQK